MTDTPHHSSPFDAVMQAASERLDRAAASEAADPANLPQPSLLLDNALRASASRIKRADPERALRPSTLDTIIGQPHIKESLAVAIRSALGRGKVLDHTLFYGPPGLGKTTFASVIATEMGHRLKAFTGPQITPREVVDLVAELITMAADSNDDIVVFIDEIHAVDPKAMTLLLPLVESFTFEEVELPPFTLVGATTDPAKIIAPLRDRFLIRYQLDYYSLPDLFKILKRTIGKLARWDDAYMDLATESPDSPMTLAIQGLARRSRGVPRTANRLAKRALDYAWNDDLAQHDPLTPEIVDTAMKAIGVDAYGLDRKDAALLIAMLGRFGGRPVGIRALASALGENPTTVEEIMEPILVRDGFVNREHRGRVLSPKGVEYAAQLLVESMNPEGTNP